MAQFRASQKQQPKSENPFVAQFRASQTNEPVRQFQQPSKNSVIRGFCGSNKADENGKDLGNGKNVSWVYDGNGILTISGIGEIADYYMSDIRPWDSFKDEITTLIINKGIRKVGKSAFSECPRIEQLVLPEGMRVIEFNAFWGCTSLNQVTFPTSLTEIKISAFDACPNLRTVTLPKSCKVFHSFRDTTSVYRIRTDSI